MRNIEHQYLDLMSHVLETGTFDGDERTGTGTYNVFGEQISHDMSLGFPLLTTKKIAIRPMVAELLWFISGDCNLKRLKELQFGDAESKKKTVWDDNYNHQGKALGYKDGNMGPIYGEQWRFFRHLTDSEAFKWGAVDQLENSVNMINSEPSSRRNIVTAWNPGELKSMVLPACHYGYQFYVMDNKLHLLWTQR